MLFVSLSQTNTIVGFLLANAVALLMLCLLVQVAVSWISAAGGRVPFYNPVLRTILKIADGVTEPIRRLVPSLRFGGVGIDFSSLIALIVLGILRGAFTAL